MADLLYPALEILRAVHFAADRHRDQRRKDVGGSPYINHPIEVAEILARIGGISDLAVLQAAILHDTIEDTETSAEVLQQSLASAAREIASAAH